MSGKAQQDAAPKKKKLPLPIIIGAVILVIALFFGKGLIAGGKPAEKTKKSKKSKSSKSHGKEDSKGNSKHEEEEEEEEEHIEVGHSMPLEEFLVNLSGGGDHYLRTTIALGLRKGLTEEKAKEHVSPVRDAILSVLAEKSLKELSTSKGRDTLKDELLEKINEVAASPEEEEEMVVKIYFTAFATQ